MSDIIEDLGNLFGLGHDLVTGKTTPSDLLDEAIDGKRAVTVEPEPAKVLRLVPKDSGGGTACETPEPVPVVPEASKA